MKPTEDRIYVSGIRNRFSGYPSKGLTPQKLGTILKEADSGDIYRQYELFEEMEEKDTHLFSVLQTRKLAVANKEWEIIAASDSTQDKKIADFIKENFENLDMENILIDLMDSIGKGFSVLEIMWDTSSLPYRIKSLDWCHQKNFIPNWSEDGSRRLEGFRYVTDENKDGIELPDRKFVIHRYKAKSGNPERGGLIRICSWMYLFKNYDIKDWVAFAEVFGMPFRLGKYEAGATEEEKKVLIDAVINLGSDAAAIIPSSTVIELIEAIKSSSVNVYDVLANFCNKEMSKAVLGQTLTTDIGDTGSYAAESGHELVRQDLVEADGKAAQRRIKLELIKPAVDVNYGVQRRYPTMKIHVEKPEDMKQEADKDKVLVDMGLKVPSTYIYNKYGIPKPKDGEEIIEPPERSTGMQFKRTFDKKIIPLKGHYTKLDSEMKDRIDEAVPHYEKRINTIKKLMAKSTGLKDLNDKLLKVNPDWKFISRNAETLKKGLYDSWKVAVNKVKSKYKLKHPYVALQNIQVDWDLPPQGAINFFRLQAFTVAHVEDYQVLEGMRQQVLKALEDGIAYGEFRKNVNNIFDSMGVSRLNSHHLSTVFNSNMQSAYMAGKFHQLNTLEEFFPYWQYITMDDGKVRPSHQSMHLKVYRKDDHIWMEWFPPNGFGCRCDVEACDEDDLAEGGFTPINSESTPPLFMPDTGWQKNVALSTTQFDKWLDQKEEMGISLDRKPGDYGWEGNLTGAKDPGNFTGDFEKFLSDLLDENNRMKTYEGKIYISEDLNKKLFKEKIKEQYAYRFKDAIIDPQEVWGAIEANDKYKIRIVKRFKDNKGVLIILKYERNTLEDMELITYTGTNNINNLEKQRNGFAIYKK